MTQNSNRQGVEDLLAKLQKECSHLEGEASSLQQDLADSQASCEQLQGALVESRWAARLHENGVFGVALLVPICICMQQDDVASQFTCRQLQGLLAEFRWAAGVHGCLQGSKWRAGHSAACFICTCLEPPANSCRGRWQTALCSRDARSVPCHQQEGCR